MQSPLSPPKKPRMDMGLDDDGGGGGGGGGPVLDADGWEVVAPKGGRKGRK